MSTIPTYQRMYKFMESTKPSTFTKSNSEGVERVQKSNGKYAFMMEATTIEYFTERKCDLIQIGGMLDSKGYGIAVRPGGVFFLIAKLNFVLISARFSKIFNDCSELIATVSNVRIAVPCCAESSNSKTARNQSSFDFEESMVEGKARRWSLQGMLPSTTYLLTGGSNKSPLPLNFIGSRTKVVPVAPKPTL